MSSHSSHLLPFNPLSQRASGFGLIELMVSVSIMVLVAGLIFARHDSFNGAVLLRSQAYEVALATREVQLSAVSADSDGTGGFRSVEGVYFSTAADNQYNIFRDADNDYRYDANEIYGKQGTIDPQFEIRGIRAVGDTISGNAISIVFERPNYDARFFDQSGEVDATSIEIDITKRGATGNGSNEVRTVAVTSTGQVTVYDEPRN